MCSTTEEIIRVSEPLPSDKQTEVSDFARFLLAGQNDEAWERRLAYPQTRPRLDAFLRDAAAEGMNRSTLGIFTTDYTDNTDKSRAIALGFFLSG